MQAQLLLERAVMASMCHPYICKLRATLRQPQVRTLPTRATRTHTHAHARAHARTRTRTRTRTHMHTCTHAHAHARTACICIAPPPAGAYMHMHMHMHMTCTCTCTCACTCVYPDDTLWPPYRSISLHITSVVHSTLRPPSRYALVYVRYTTDMPPIGRAICHRYGGRYGARRASMPCLRHRRRSSCSCGCATGLTCTRC